MTVLSIGRTFGVALVWAALAALSPGEAHSAPVAPLGFGSSVDLFSSRGVGAPALPAKLAEAIEALARGDHDRALTLSREFLREAPQSVDGHQVRAAAAIGKRDFKEAEAAVAEALRLDPKQARSVALRALLLIASNDVKGGEAELRRALQLDPRLPGISRVLASTLWSQGRVSQAVEVAESAARTGGDPNDLYALSVLYFEQGRFVESEGALTRALAARADHPQAELMMGLVKLAVLKVDEAAVFLQRAAARDPGSQWARLGTALVVRSRGQLAEAAGHLEKLGKDFPTWPLAHRQLAETLLAQKRADAAMPVFERAEQASADKAFAQIQSARILLAYGEADRAIAKARAVRGTPQAASLARGVIADAYVAKRDVSAAEKELQAGVAAAPKDPLPAMHLGRFYATQRRWPDALKQFEQAVTLNPEGREPRIAVIDAHLAMKQSSEAIKAAQGLLKLEKDSVAAWILLASTQERAGRPAEARESYQRALQKEPGHLGASIALAALHQREKRPELAAALLQAAANAHPRSAVPMVELAMLREREKNFGGAVSAYREALQREPDHLIAMNNLAVRLGEDPRTRDESLAIAERAMQVAPRSPIVADTLGWILYRKGDVDRAQKFLEQAAAGLPQDPSVRYHMAHLYAKRGKRAEARRELEAALRNPNFSEAGEAKQLLDALR